ncbi:MAG: FtsW/RodA/SpoVE family cell cycle protein [Limosilactobacillus sp.]|uniref:FtsW/RodA/SpoVE family cell cycle protein n=1 Tax=Limosilactobacillus sp. TaxID=2773925 RepID=UPI0026F75BD2|nr:FtsW/RodA/SpoVE family cell cycle protein [Limosilactobacillus sp.]
MVKNRNLIDWFIFLPFIALCVIGVVMVYSASAGINMQNGGNPTSYLIKQLLYAVIGLICVTYFANTPLGTFRTVKFRNWSTLIMVGSLVLVLLIGSRINGARGWINLGIINVQPAEFCKLYLILFLSDRLEVFKARSGHFLTDGKPAVKIIGVFSILLILIGIQPDTGGLAINLAIGLIIWLACDVKSSYSVRFILGCIALLIIGIPIIVQAGLISGYRAERFTAYMNPFGNVSGSGSQLVNSYYAISNGGVFGVGIGNSIQKMGYLPEPNTDFIMSIIAEELGAIGVTVILVLLVTLICRTIIIGIRSRYLYDTLICYGVAAFIFIETSFNVGGVLGVLPITGVTFPFISYGGSSMIVLSSAMGLVLNISMKQKRQKAELAQTTGADYL